MTPTPEEIAAFADGELDEPRRAEIAALVESDPALAAQVRRHRALRAKLSAHYAPILEQPVPERLEWVVRPAPSPVASIAEARTKREARKGLPKWSYFAGPALAASLVLALFMGGSDETPDGYAGVQVASALDTQVSGQGSGATRVLLSFRDEAGEYCRAFASDAASGIACRDDTGWRLEESGAGAEAQTGEYRQAGSAEAALMARAQEMASGQALSAAEEREAAKSGWR